MCWSIQVEMLDNDDEEEEEEEEEDDEEEEEDNADDPDFNAMIEEGVKGGHIWVKVQMHSSR